MKQIRLDEIKEPSGAIRNHQEPDNDDWKYRPILKTNTKCNYDSDGIQQDIIDEFENIME